jgi:hypothetical protein
MDMSRKLEVLAVAAACAVLAGGVVRAAVPESLQEVTVTAHRIEFEKRVSQFVNQIAASENVGEGLARWQVPSVCPLVSGLPRRDGEFILERLSEIAHAAGVPLADEHCSPNLYILVTSQPEDLLRGMEKQNRRFTFGFDASHYPPVETAASVVDEFIKTPRAVRVWYNSAEKDASGTQLAYCRESDLLPDADPSLYVRCGHGISGGSHLASGTVWTFSSVFVIVDQGRFQGVTVRQLADYTAMVGFAKLRPDARLGDAPTILALFNGAPGAAPAGMTDWDQTFLKSLYVTDQRSKLQRSQIAREMVREIAP